MTEVILATTPPAGTPVPPAIRQFADGRPTRLIWENRLGGLTALVKDKPVTSLSSGNPTIGTRR